MADNIGNEIKEGFNALAGGFREAGRNRVNELVQKQGYVAYKNQTAADLFKNNPEYSNWECKKINDEYRFYPPKKNDYDDTYNNLLNTYKELKKDMNNSTCISIKMLNDGSNKCEYKLISTNRRTGLKEVIQHYYIDINNKFMLETLPSLYYSLCNQMPVIDNEKETSINFISMNSKDMILIGNLNSEQLDFIKKMKKFVDDKLNISLDKNIKTM